jgi:cytochrome P450
LLWSRGLKNGRGGAQLDVIALHRNEARGAFFPKASAQPIFFDTTIKAWVVANPRHCEAMLVSPHLFVSPYRPAYEDMAKRHRDYAFPNLLFAFKYIPMCLNGDDHKTARRQIAEYLAARKGAVSAAAADMVDRRFGGLATRERVELMTEAIEPLVKDVLGTLNRTDEAGRVLIRSASAVFDRMMGAKKRRELDDEIAEIRGLIRRGLGPDAGEDQEGFSLALFILGNDALAGTLGESLHQILLANRGRCLSEIDYPATPPATGVPFVERIVMEPFEYEGTPLRKGERIRILLQSFQYSGDAADRIRIFGAGIHACLGRQLSLEIWSLITRKLSEITARAEIIDYALRYDDYVFAYPTRLSIALKR